jgi:hypothetical protein
LSLAYTARTTKPLLRWMDDGDPDLVPVLMADARSTAASYYGLPVRTEGTSVSYSEREASPITPAMIADCARQLGVHFHWNIGSMSPFDTVEFMDDVELVTREEIGPRGETRKFTTIRTPVGEISDIFVTPRNEPAFWATHLVKSESDLPALAHLIERSADVSLDNERFRSKITGRLKSEAQKWPEYVVLYAILGVPAFALSCNLFVDPTTAFYLMADNETLMERLYEAYEQCNGVWLECAAEAGADFALGAINGLELFSPDIYNRYFIPQARHLYSEARKLGMGGWTHTCGYMNQLIEMGVYDDTGVDVLESLSLPPSGDIADLRRSRVKLGNKIVTRGAINVEMLYDDDIASLRARTRQVLDDTRGYRHMVGDTNDSFPPYPRESILALVDEVRSSGRMLSA